ncbi:Hypothetical predicted protein [Cloeon dipterum]|uniref:Uncharacterized protein n=1 Tax=Cloeon dipterum TaxID=197152 RepID=A0A8S1DF17_9INSE|nr:Hypothetical predicted protein [Cloeon dipterum]
MHLMAKLLEGLGNWRTSKAVRKCVSKTFNAEDPENYVVKILKKCYGSKIQRATLLKLLSVQNFNKLDRRGADITKIMLPALRHLLRVASDVEVLDLTGIVSYSPAADQYQHLESAIIQVSERATNLLSLSILQEESLRVEKQTLGQAFVHAFAKMEHLQVLRIEEFEILICDLSWLCKELQNLRFISVDICGSEILMMGPEIILDSFKRLKAFFFRMTATSSQDMIEFKNLCQMNLFNLQVLEDFASDFCSQRKYQYASHMIGDRNLRHLCLNLQYEKAEEGLHKWFPHVTHLKIEGPTTLSDYEWKIEPLLKFFPSKIESLHLSHVPLEIVLQFLTSYGSDLQSLFLGNSIFLKESESSLKPIFDLCPKLESVGLVEIEGTLPKSTFTMLNEVILKYDTVLDILIAPNLEKVTLLGQVVNEDHMRRLTDLISKKEALGKLKTLVVCIECNSITEVKQPFFLAVADFVKTAARVLPTLTEIQFRVNHMCNYIILAKSLMCERFENDEIAGVGTFFSLRTNFDEFQWFIDGGLIDTLNKFSVQ